MSPIFNGCRALDLTQELGAICGKFLADTGVEVIKVEPPGGDPARKDGPFFQGQPCTDHSLSWEAFNSGKKSVVLNVETNDGKEILKKLVGRANVVIESFAPGHLDQIGLGYKVLAASNPGLVLTSITPFGSSGPHRDYKAGDLVCMAMSGLMYLTGDADRAPLRMSYPQAPLQAGVQAFLGTVLALYHARITGLGQVVDVSAQQALATASHSSLPFADIYGLSTVRSGHYRTGFSTDKQQRAIWPCKDGYVTVVVVGGVLGAKSNKALALWLDEEGLADDFLRSFDWDSYDLQAHNQAVQRRLEEGIARLFMSHSKADLYREALKRRIQITPVYQVAETAADPQFVARNFWAKVTHPAWRTELSYPGPFVRTNVEECQLKAPRPAPLLGQHNNEIYGEIGLSNTDIVALAQAGVM